jgi:hypothetical protein
LREKLAETGSKSRSGCGEGRAGGYPADFKHAMADVSVLGQMRGSSGFTSGGDHLVEGAAFAELRI